MHYQEGQLLLCPCDRFACCLLPHTTYVLPPVTLYTHKEVICVQSYRPGARHAYIDHCRGYTAG